MTKSVVRRPQDAKPICLPDDELVLPLLSFLHRRLPRTKDLDARLNPHGVRIEVRLLKCPELDFRILPATLSTTNNTATQPSARSAFNTPPCSAASIVLTIHTPLLTLLCSRFLPPILPRHLHRHPPHPRSSGDVFEYIVARLAARSKPEAYMATRKCIFR
ncbi:hypothetical protein LshimejAT787_1100170 [Lyophyllum shimeji]|uniref:Uncharacterized protein n=1 Tax=Lyophyllum shimeji TaxID=47721 RepID=A0A9P3PVG8_LYOSH|nr:hypothetical protein LshimejAT787_1100110 [Lyophyllum shimeji]GLB42002.1 hypothetical protein LshimejAT787_1100170 [Lyophyllum shimeji]